MGSQKTLNKQYSIVDGNVVINETVEKVLTLDDLQREKTAYQQRQNQIKQQMELLKDQHVEIKNAIKELDDMIAAIPAVDLPTIK